MSKIDEAASVLAALGLPHKQQNERSALTLLALANLSPSGSWADVSRPMLRTVDIIEYIKTHYNKIYKPNSRETFRKETIHQFEQARIVDRNPDNLDRPTTSPMTNYRLTKEAADALKVFGTANFAQSIATFIEQFGSLRSAYERLRASHQISLCLLNGSMISLSPGDHNTIQVSIIEDFGPRFAPGATVLYMGDTAKKFVIHERDQLAQIGVPITEHDKLPDLVLYDPDKNWLFLIEAVTSTGPVSPKRHREIEAFLKGCTAERIYVTAFLSITDFRKYAVDIAWETEVWIATTPDHMIHFNGQKFLGPYKPHSG